MKELKEIFEIKLISKYMRPVIALSDQQYLEE